MKKISLVGCFVFGMTLSASQAQAQAQGAAKAAQVVGLVSGLGATAAALGLIPQCNTNQAACVMAAMTLGTAAQAFGGSGSASKTSGSLASTGNSWNTDCTKPENQNSWMCKSMDTPNLSAGQTENNGFRLGPGGGTAIDDNTRNLLGPNCTDCNPDSARQLLTVAQDKLRDMGVGITPDGKSVTLPGGGTTPIAAAMTPQNIEEMNRRVDGEVARRTGMTLAQLAGKMQSSLVSADNGTGGGTGVAGAGGDAGGAAGGGGFDFKLPGMPGDNRLPSSAAVEGLSRPLGDDKIGVAGDDIFKMINRAYARAHDRSEFIP